MADQEKCTRSTARVLRESFIANFQRDGQEAALRLLDDLAHQFTCEQRGDYLMGENDDSINAPKRSARPATSGRRRTKCASRPRDSRRREVATGARCGWRWRLPTPPPPCSRSPMRSTPLSPPTSRHRRRKRERLARRRRSGASSDAPQARRPAGRDRPAGRRHQKPCRRLRERQTPPSFRTLSRILDALDVRLLDFAHHVEHVEEAHR